MPYEIKKSGEGFKVFKKGTSKAFSKSPMTKKEADAQLKALYANTNENKTMKKSELTKMIHEIIKEVINEQSTKLKSRTLTEGQFSWMTQDTGEQIGSEKENKLPAVYMFDNMGNNYKETNYEGYGEFGGMDYYGLLDKMNGGNGDRIRGIRLAFNKIKTDNKVLFPALVTNPNFNWKSHDFTQQPENDPNQSWYQEPEEDDYNGEVSGDWGDDEDEDDIYENKKPSKTLKNNKKTSKMNESMGSQRKDGKIVMNNLDNRLDWHLVVNGPKYIQATSYETKDDMNNEIANLNPAANIVFSGENYKEALSRINSYLEYKLTSNNSLEESKPEILKRIKAPKEKDMKRNKKTTLKETIQGIIKEVINESSNTTPKHIIIAQLMGPDFFLSKKPESKWDEKDHELFNRLYKMASETGSVPKMNEAEKPSMFVTGGSINPELRKKVEQFVKGIAKYYDYSVDDAFLAIMTILKGGLNKMNEAVIDTEKAFRLVAKGDRDAALDALKKLISSDKEYSNAKVSYILSKGNPKDIIIKLNGLGARVLSGMITIKNPVIKNNFDKVSTYKPQLTKIS